MHLVNETLYRNARVSDPVLDRPLPEVKSRGHSKFVLHGRGLEVERGARAGRRVGRDGRRARPGAAEVSWGTRAERVGVAGTGTRAGSARWR